MTTLLLIYGVSLLVVITVLAWRIRQRRRREQAIRDDQAALEAEREYVLRALAKDAGDTFTARRRKRNPQS